MLRRYEMVWAPTKVNREAIRFWLDCLQIVTVVAGVVALATTFIFKYQEEREQLAAVKRELERPYQEKKLALYLDAARVLARLATGPTLEKEATEARFWELYWGELALVESDRVQGLMVKFCKKYFDPARCTTSDDKSKTKAAINLAQRASKEVRKRWETIGQ
jgi:hypothetical protein